MRLHTAKSRPTGTPPTYHRIALGVQTPHRDPSQQLNNRFVSCISILKCFVLSLVAANMLEGITLKGMCRLNRK